jgi:formylglycine-generating enzyme required for sulfatase activity
MNQSSKQLCPQCSEPVKPTWRLCPACETRLQPLNCPQCGSEVNANWRRCPECEALLVCRECGTRLAPGEDACPRCHPAKAAKQASPPVFKDTVCGIELVLIGGGTFAMGDTLDQGIDNEQPVHQVKLDEYYISRFPTTQAQWSQLVEDNPSAFKHPENPVEQVTWMDACDFARKLTDAQQEAVAFMLPTEAQWEYAARSGGRDQLYAGGDDIDAVAWYELNSQGTPQPVGRKRPNDLGLFDMSGNVWEWCRDTFHPDAYTRHGSQNPETASAGKDRVIRGGSWNLDAWSARCARRFNFRTDFFGPGLGFRLVMRFNKPD